jgi:hypothetical protein
MAEVEPPKVDFNIPALAAGVTSLFSVIGALTATGLLGRMERNEPEALLGAVLIVLLGAVMLVLAGLPITSGRSEIFATLVGTGLTVVGIGWVVGAGIRDASHSELPALTFSLDAKDSLVKGSGKVGNLASDDRFALLVEGLRPGTEGRTWDAATLAQYYVGPDGEGKVDLPVEVNVPTKEGYTAVGIRAWSGDDNSCRTYPRRGAGFSKEVKSTGAGCVWLRMPPAAASTDSKGAASGAAKPSVSLSWVGHRVNATRVRLAVSLPGAGPRAVVLVAGRRRSGEVRQIQRTVARVGTSGGYRTRLAVRVGPGFTRVCARADLIAKGARAPKRLRRCPLPRSVKIGSGGAELRRPR